MRQPVIALSTRRVKKEPARRSANAAALRAPQENGSAHYEAAQGTALKGGYEIAVFTRPDNLVMMRRPRVFLDRER